MGMATLLSDDEVASALTDLPGWTGDSGGIHRVVRAPSFLDGIRLVDAVAAAADAADHHPDIDIRWRTVTFRLTSHSAGGVTVMDLAMARKINEIMA